MQRFQYSMGGIWVAPSVNRQSQAVQEKQLNLSLEISGNQHGLGFNSQPHVLALNASFSDKLKPMIQINYFLPKMLLISVFIATESKLWHIGLTQTVKWIICCFLINNLHFLVKFIVSSFLRHYPVMQASSLKTDIPLHWC